MKGVMKTNSYNEDYKTAGAHGQRNLKEGEEVRVIESMRNLYGTYLYVEASDGETFYIKQDKVEIIENEKE